MGKKKPKGNGRHAADKKPPSCYVLSLSVENVRCFGPKQTLDCSDGEGRPRQWTVILGDNGTGKTTLLQAITCHEWWATPGEDKLKGDPRVYLHASGFGRGPDDLNEARSELNATRQPVLQCVGGMGLSGSWEVVDTIARYESGLYDFAVHGYGPNRGLITTEPETRTQQNQPDDRSATLFHRGAVLRDGEKLLLNLDYASKSDGGETQKGILERVEEVLLKVLPGIYELRYDSGSGYFPRPRVEFKTDFGWVPLRQLGHGYQTMIAWVVDFVSRMVERYPDSENPLAEPAVCLVDEIDLHLHPVWQRKVIGYLSERFPNTQFIVTAHSPLVVQAAASADANIAVLVRSEEKDADGNHYVEIKNNPEDVRNWRLDQILTSDLFGNLDLRSAETEKLFARKRELLGKPKRTRQEEAELAAVEAEITALPVGDTEKFARELELLRRASDELKSSRKP